MLGRNTLDSPRRNQEQPGSRCKTGRGSNTGLGRKLQQVQAKGIAGRPEADKSVGKPRSGTGGQVDRKQVREPSRDQITGETNWSRDGQTKPRVKARRESRQVRNKPGQTGIQEVAMHRKQEELKTIQQSDGLSRALL